MAGESLDAVHVDGRGLEGDRWFAVVDEDGRLATGKNSRRFRRRDEIFELRATTTADGVRIEGRGGAWLVGDPMLDEALSGHMGARVRVPPRATSRTRTVRRSRSSAPHRWTGVVPHQGVDADVRRLRTNLVVETTEPFVEETWAGRQIRIGGAEIDGGRAHRDAAG